MGVRFSRVVVAAALLAVGLLAASPFLCRRLVGTGEAFNYSLSVADAVVQMRHGIVPPLAGQTQYAFNGRIHPLRNAPYLYYLAGAIDAVTFRRLQVWELQNASLALSLVAAVFACYVGLRWATACPRPLAFFLATAYGLSPALLCVAHSLNLFMTVHAAVFVPLAIAACVKGCRQPSLSTDLCMGAALALAWLAHPPVALWLTWGVMLVRVVAFLGDPGWRPLARAAAAAVLGLLLAGFGFASVATLNTDLNYFEADPATWHNFASIILFNLRLALPGSLLPVTASGNGYSDLQFGYTAWVLLALTFAFLFKRSRGQAGWDRQTRLATAGTCAFVGLLLVLTFPVPGITYWLWVHMPVAVLQLTYGWPMQRLYLVAAGFTVFGAGLALPARWHALGTPRWVAPALVALGMAWTLFEAKRLVNIGFANRHALVDSEAAYRPSNLNLTRTSYAFFGAPPTFINGADDPLFEYRLLKGGQDEVKSNYGSALSSAPVVQRGSIGVNPQGHASVVGFQTVTLEPGHRYLITFSFKTAPFPGWLEFVGPLVGRTYALPSAGESGGFGMGGGNRKALSLWTDSDKPEQVRVTMGVVDGATLGSGRVELADFSLQDVDVAALPVRVDGYLPLRLEVNSPQSGCTVETPQRYLGGYAATLNGRPVPVMMSPWRNVMVGVPPGRSVVEVRYVGPASVRAAFWVSALCWAGFLLWFLAGARASDEAGQMALAAVCACSAIAWRQRFLLAAAAAAAAAALWWQHKAREQRDYLSSVGPIEVRFTLPYGKNGASQPLVATGHALAGVIVFVNMIDEHHVRLGADVWGTLYSSELLEVDYSQLHTLVVSDSALFPVDHPGIKALPGQEAERLRRELRVELDGTVAIDANCYAFEAGPGEVHVGSTPFGSTSAARFTGEIADSRRLPIPRLVGMPWGGRAHLKLRFPSDRDGVTESLITFTSGAWVIAYTVTYTGDHRLRFASSGPNGVPIQSAEVDADLTKTHTMDFWPSEPGDAAASFDLSCDFDGRHLLGGTKPLVLAVRPLMSSGVDLSAPRAAGTRFSGPELSLTLTSDGTSTGSIEEFGPAHMIVTLPSQKAGRREPILTTGRTGAGDLVYFVYEDGQHVRIGFDHWNFGGTLTPPIAIDYKVPHDIWVVEGSLYPDVGDNALWGAIDLAARVRLKSQVEVYLDGRLVLSEARAAYPATKDEVTIAKNRIGGSTADPDFSGILHYSERTGSVLPPGTKL
jgi:hypothetical protein